MFHRPFPMLAALLLSAVLLAGCPPRPDLAVSATAHHFGIDPNTGDYETEWNFQVWNSGKRGTTLVFTVEAAPPWVEILPTTVGQSTGSDDKITFTARINRDYSDLKALDFAKGVITVKSSVRDRAINVTTAPDYFTEAFQNGTDLDGTAITLTPNGGPSFYGKTKSDIDEFPTDPAGGFLLNFGAFGNPVRAGLFGDATVPFYGKDYSELFISSGGWVSFGKRGNAPATLGAHFATPQISMLPVVGTDPNAMVSYLQDDDKLVITYEDAPSANGAGDLNDFQIEMFFDGRVRLNFLNVDPTISGILGLSVGSGVGGIPPADFLESDLTDANTAPLKAALD